jgi:transposase
VSEWTPPYDLIGIMCQGRLLAKAQGGVQVNDTAIAVDVAKNVFQLGISDRPGQVRRTERLSRAHFLPFLAAQPATTVVMEACGSAQHWASRIEQLGHRVVLLPAHLVRPYVRGNKTDRTDVKGILEAFRNEDIRPVPIKTPAHQALAALHRLRSAWVAERTARINTIRGLLREFGIFIPMGSRRVVPEVFSHLEDADAPIPDSLRPFLAEACDEVRDIERRIALVERQLKALAEQTPAVQRLLTVPGVGLISATALFAFVVNVHRFLSARHLASYLGLTPRERSSGNARRLGAITKRGDVYLRMLLVHGARSVLAHAKQPTEAARRDHLREWAVKVEKARGHNKAAVALANKMARMVWAVWRHDRDYHPVPVAA